MSYDNDFGKADALTVRLQQCTEKITKYFREDYVKNERLVGAHPSPLFLNTTYTHRFEYENFGKADAATERLQQCTDENEVFFTETSHMLPIAAITHTDFGKADAATVRLQQCTEKITKCKYFLCCNKNYPL
ncbi:uncharacterized protein [Littorina saxatilis]|uniref:uncharacterized protein n=1 Tax=Littorina saxatilis TaxID=31220 RepID=UPI0038B4885C